MLLSARTRPVGAQSPTGVALTGRPSMAPPVGAASLMSLAGRSMQFRVDSTSRLTQRGSTWTYRAQTRKGLVVSAGLVPPGETVLVLGATGGVGQIVTAKLLERNYTVKAVTRSKSKAMELFGGAGDKLQVVVADSRDPASLKSMMEGVHAVACCTGTTAFPSKRWDGDNGPEQTDYIGTKNIVEAAKRVATLKRFVLVSSVGVDRYNQFPYLVLNAFGVLKFKKMGEDVLKASGMPYTIIRPGRLTDGPYTSYDLNTLLQATSGNRQDVELSAKDDQNGEASRIAVAECVVQALNCDLTESMDVSLISREGDGPGKDPAAWKRLFSSIS